MRGFIDLTNIDTIKSLPKDIIDDNWIELNYLYNKVLVEGDLEMVDILKKYIILAIWNFLGIISNIKSIDKYYIKYIIILNKYYDTYASIEY